MSSDKEYVYECYVYAECITDMRCSFQKTFAVCTTQKKARLYRKGYLLEEWKHKGYKVTKDKTEPYQPGHIYYVENDLYCEKWILNTYIIRRHLDDLWIDYTQEDYDE